MSDVFYSSDFLKTCFLRVPQHHERALNQCGTPLIMFLNLLIFEVTTPIMKCIDNTGLLSCTAAAEKGSSFVRSSSGFLYHVWKQSLLKMPVKCSSSYLYISVRGPREWMPAEGKSGVNKYQHVKHIVNGINLGHHFHYLET